MYSYLLEELSKTIGARLRVWFKHNGHTYEAEPHMLGRNLNKQDCLLAWVTSSSSPSASEEGWFTFPLNEVEDVKPTEERFCKQRPGYDPYDSSMSRIYYRL